MLRLRDLHGVHDSAETFELSVDAWRLRLARCLLWASAALTRLACRLSLQRRRRGRRPELEFYGEAAAPEGALYVDGQLFGKLQGVKRL